MTRTEIATAALQGLAAGLQWRAGLIVYPEEMAADAVALADALLAELEKSANSTTDNQL